MALVKPLQNKDKDFVSGVYENLDPEMNDTLHTN
jgi:hypothetical protein